MLSAWRRWALSFIGSWSAARDLLNYYLGLIRRKSADQLAGRSRFGDAGHRHHHHLVDGQWQYDHLPGGLAGYIGGLVRSGKNRRCGPPGKRYAISLCRCCMPVNAFVIPLTIIACWRVFGQVFVMTRGGPQGSTFTIAQFIYETAFVKLQYGLGLGGRRHPDGYHAKLHRRAAARDESDIAARRQREG